MATIVARRLKDGSMSYRATIRVMRGNTVTYRETKTFRNQKQAANWSRQREVELKRDGGAAKAIEAAASPRKSRPAHKRVSLLGPAATSDGNALSEIGIPAVQERIYRMLLQVEGATISDVSAQMKASPRIVQQAMTSLEKNRLVINSLERVPRYFAAPPALAIEALMARREAKIRATIEELHKITKVTTGQSGEERLIEVVSREVIGQVIYQLIKGAEREIICVQRQPILLKPDEQNDELQYEQLARGVKFRTITDSSILNVPVHLDRVRAIAKAGEQIRLHPGLPVKFIAVDHRIALLPLDLVRPDSPWALVSSLLLDALYELFEVLWRSSVPLWQSSSDSREAASLEDGLPSDVDMLLPMLVAGLNDKAIELKLGVSKRTLTRRMVELTKQLGATTRFQAGWLAAQAARTIA